jgi:hypothetical protein
MTDDLNRFGIDQTEELPDRVEHRRKIAERLALDSREYAPADPSRTIDRAGSGHRAHGLGAGIASGSGRGPCAT